MRLSDSRLVTAFFTFLKAGRLGRHDTTGHRGTRPHPPLGGLLAGVGDLPLAAHQDPFGWVVPPRMTCWSPVCSAISRQGLAGQAAVHTCSWPSCAYCASMQVRTVRAVEGSSWHMPRAVHHFLLARARCPSRGEEGVAMSRHRKALIFLTALLAATLSYASFASAKTDNITV
jgi:hypothetical protein